MYYPKDDPDWLPLCDAVSKLELELAPFIRECFESPTTGGKLEIDQHIWAAAWSACDNCQTAVLTSQGSIVLLSKSLFTRESNDSPYGDFLKLDIGQLGSQDWPLWAGFDDPDPDEDRMSEKELKRLLHPFYSHHVLISAKAFEAELAKQKAVFAPAQATPKSPKPRGRPAKIHSALEVYKSLYPKGHDGQTAAEVIKSIATNGGPTLSRDSLRRMLKNAPQSKKDRQK